MNLPVKRILIFLLLIIFVYNADGQVDEICSEAGFTPSLDPPLTFVPYVYGRITLTGFDPNSKFPNVTISLVEVSQSPKRFTISKSGNYCFKLRGRSGATLILEVNGVETARRSLISFAPEQQREDFEIHAAQTKQTVPPGVVSAKFFHPPNPKTAELYKKTVEAEKNKEQKKLIEYFKQIVALDPEDFIAWAKLGLLYFGQESFVEADNAFKKSLELKIEFTFVWINVGKMRMVQKQYAAAIEIFKYVLELEPNSAKTVRLLGEAYLQNKQGTLGAQALNKAIELDPIGMAECHLQLAHLYQLAKANQMAAKEYKLFLSKVPNHPDKNKFEEFIKKNP